MQRRRLLDWTVAAYPISAAALTVLTALAPQQGGVLALLQIFMPHLCLAAVLLTPAVALARLRRTAIALVVLASLTGLRFGGEWVSLPPHSADDRPIRLVSWNLEAGSRAAAEIGPRLLELDADIVALQELTPEVARALADDSRITDAYPHRLLSPDTGVLGMGLLSRLALSESQSHPDPPAIEAVLDLGDGRRLAVLNAHPLPGRIGFVGRSAIPITFDPADRDLALEALRGRIDSLRQEHASVIALGDFNMVSTEPAYARFVSGLRDLHTEVGNGLGWTWRPSRLESWNLGVLRLDYVFLGPGLGGQTVDVDCSIVGDHCILIGEILVPMPDALPPASSARDG